jgi:sphingolipid delta-4 desaturase
MNLPQNDYIHVDYSNPHLQRMRQILSTHPEVKELFGYTPSTALYAIAIVLLQILLGVILKHSSVWIILISAYLIGAMANHALFVIIHECTHNLVFKKPVSNRLLAIFVNFPQFFPSAMSFFKYHMLHHTNQSEFNYDPDIAGIKEASFIKNSPFRKTLFLTFFGLIQGLVRPARLKRVEFFDRWFAINFILQFCFLAVIFYFFGWKVLLYFFLSTFFGLGLHPLGARWVQEHYVMSGTQETYSYYGPLNKLCFNMGYHNEHHDLMKVAWSRLPKVRAMAPEFYDTLYFHKSWTALLFKFIFDRNISLFNRVVRPSRES